MKAAGGDLSHIPTDGYDIAPLLSKSQATDPHQALVWRDTTNWVVSKGDWKLFSDPSFAPNKALYNLASDPQEQVDQSRQHPEIVTDLMHELTFWEAQMQKPRWGDNTENQFDSFVFRSDAPLGAKWSDQNVWQQAGTATAVVLHTLDSYANATLEFPVNNDGDFSATNDMTRVTNQTFMLNQLRLTGNFQSNVAHSGVVNGNSLLLVKSLDGHLPQIRLDAVSSGTSAKFTYHVGNQLQLLDNLEITGDGNQSFFIDGGITDYFQPCDVTKSGASQIVLTANNPFKGTLRINGGRLSLQGDSAAVTDAAAIVIGAGGELVLDGGNIDVPLLDNSAGGMFQFNGGSLHADQILGNILDGGATLSTSQITGNLENPGGTLLSGPLAREKKIHGNFSQHGGTMQVVIGGDANGNTDQNTIDGIASLGGTLAIRTATGFVLSAGQRFQFLTAAGGVNGAFQNVVFPTLSGISWHLIYGSGNVTLAIDSSAAASDLAGDYNDDGIVDAADYVICRNSFGSTTRLAADGNNNGVIDSGDFDVWRANFGRHAAATLSTTASADYNHDGIVDAADYAIWRSTLGSTTRLAADGNHNGIVDSGDYDLWKMHFGEIVAAASAAAAPSRVPESATWLLAALGGQFAFKVGRRSTAR